LKKIKKTKKMRCRFIKGSDYCWRHSNIIAEHEKKSASALGGANRRIYFPTNLPEVVLKSMSDIPPMLVDTIQHLRKGAIDVRLGTAIGYLSNVLMKSYEITDLEQRVEKVENYIKGNLKGELTDDYEVTSAED
jgi:hypothetical protein